MSNRRTQLRTRATSDYEWNIQDNILWIMDLDQGRKAVTNDMENVLADIKTVLAMRGGNLPENIIYRDSDGNWDRVVNADSGDVDFEPTSRVFKGQEPEKMVEILAILWDTK